MTEPYRSAAAVEAAIRDAARRGFAADNSMSTQDRIRQEYFRRFLSRVFSEHDDSEWLLKGGTGVLARVASGRRTTDVDLFRANNSLDGALAELIRLAAIVVTDEVTVAAPANRLDLPRLPSNDYRLYPVVDQIADKVCATMAEYSGRPSSREKDLVDLVVLGTTQTVTADTLRRAVLAEARARSLPNFTALAIPPTWGRAYSRDATDVPYCADYWTVDLAVALMRTFIDPVLQGEASGLTWSPELLAWS